MKAIVRRDTGEVYEEYLRKLAEASGIEKPTAEDARRMDRGRKKKTSNKEWVSSTDPDARVARLKDGRTRLAYKAEHVTDLDTGAIVAAEMHPADASDTSTFGDSLESARVNVLSTASSPSTETEDGNRDDDEDGPGASRGATGEVGLRSAVEVVADKGYYKTSVLAELDEKGFRTYVPEPHRRYRRRLRELSKTERRAVVENRRRTRRKKSKALHRRRGELLERTFAHVCETGAARRTRLRGRENVAKRYMIQAAAANLGLVMRNAFGVGTPRGWAALRALVVILRVAAVLASPWLLDTPEA